MLKKIKLPCYGIELTVDVEEGNGTITSELKETPGEISPEIDVIESFILACACAGVDVEDFKFLEAIETTVEAVFNRMD